MSDVPTFNAECPGCQTEHQIVPPAESVECKGKYLGVDPETRKQVYEGCDWLLDVTEQGGVEKNGILHKPKARWVGIAGEVMDAKLTRGAPMAAKSDQVIITDDAAPSIPAPPKPVSSADLKRRRGRAPRTRGE